MHALTLIFKILCTVEYFRLKPKDFGLIDAELSVGPHVSRTEATLSFRGVTRMMGGRPRLHELRYLSCISQETDLRPPCESADCEKIKAA